MQGKMIVKHKDEGLRNNAFDLPRVFKVLPEDCDGKLAVWEEAVPEGAGPPLHVHVDQYELFSVLEGHLRIRCGDETTELKAGGYVLIPPNTPHTFKGLAPDGSRCVLSLSPGAGASFFMQVDSEGLDPGEHMDRIVEIGKAHGLAARPSGVARKPLFGVATLVNIPILTASGALNSGFRAALNERFV